MRRRISIWGCVRPSVRPSVRRSVRRSVRPYVPCYFRRWKESILGASCAVYPALFPLFAFSLSVDGEQWKLLSGEQGFTSESEDDECVFNSQVIPHAKSPPLWAQISIHFCMRNSIFLRWFLRSFVYMFECILVPPFVGLHFFIL